MAIFRQLWDFIVLLLCPNNEELNNKFQKSCDKVLLDVSACFSTAFNFVEQCHLVWEPVTSKDLFLRWWLGTRQAGVHPKSALEEQGPA